MIKVIFCPVVKSKELLWQEFFYKDPEVLILDEFTSALDQDTEKSILENIKTYQKEKNKTIILISHKIGPLKYCNKIILLKDGKIIDQLNFEDYKKKYI